MTEPDADREDILPRLRSMMESMTRSDMKIAKLILAAPHDFVKASVRSVAADLGVSEPTVVRFCRTIGCEGFKDLKFRLIQELALSQAMADQGAAPLPRSARNETHLGMPDFNSVAGKVMEVLARTRDTVAHADILKAAQMIAGAPRVVVYGIGGSSAVLATEVHNRLYRLNVPAMAFTDGYAQRMSAAILNEGDVALFVSSTGRPRELQESMELARYYKAHCIAITDSDTPLGREADICLHVGLFPAGIEEFQPNPMRFAQLLVIDMLAYAVAVVLGDRAHLSLRKARGSVAWLHGITPQQPIGD
jgi:DNA-binding MurR/RpiR family transcriptional regulator